MSLSAVVRNLAVLDLAVSDLHVRVGALRKERAKLEAELGAIRSDQGAAEARAVALAHALRIPEGEIAELEDALKKLEARYLSLKNSKELGLYNDEVALIKKKIGLAEERMMAALEEQETLERDRKALAALEAARVESFADPFRRLERDEQNLAVELTKLERLRREAAGLVPEPHLGRYETLRTEKRAAVAFVVTGNCGACRLTIPKSILDEMKDPERLKSCGSCGRYIVYTDVRCRFCQELVDPSIRTCPRCRKSFDQAAFVPQGS